jgi:hypothetical protein
MLTIHDVHEIHEFEDHEVNPRSGKRVDEGAGGCKRSMCRGRPVCAECWDRPAVTRIRGRHVVSPDHDLCRQCWKSRIDSGHATRLARRVLPRGSR